MYLFSGSHTIKNDKLQIPYEMRAVLGYHQGCLVTLSYSTNTSSILQNQILVSSIPHERRQDLWSLRACFKDRPGILTELTDFLTQFNLDIWSCYGATRNQNSEFVVDLDFDAQFYESHIDKTSEKRKDNPRPWLQELYARIACRFIEDLSIRPDRKPDLYLKRNRLLSRSTRNLIQRYVSEMQDGNISIPRGMMEKIRENFAAIYGQDWASKIDRERATASAMLVADPELRGLTLTLVFPHTGHIHARISAKNQVGTIAMITNALFGKGFNILQTYTRNLHAAERSLTDLLLHLRPGVANIRDDADLRAFVRHALHDPTLKKLNCSLELPKPQIGNGRPPSKPKR
jgi:hypothetical protein